MQLLESWLFYVLRADDWKLCARGKTASSCCSSAPWLLSEMFLRPSREVRGGGGQKRAAHHRAGSHEQPAWIGEEQETPVSGSAHDFLCFTQFIWPCCFPLLSGTSHTGNNCGGAVVSLLSSSVRNQHFYLQEWKQSTEREALPSTAEGKYKGLCEFVSMTNIWESAGLASELQTHNLTGPSGARTPGRSILCFLPVLPHRTWVVSPSRLFSTCLDERQVTTGRGSISKSSLSLRGTTA